MKNFLRVIKYVKPYIHYIIFGAICMLFFAIINSILVYMVSPVLRFLFEQGNINQITDIPTSGAFFDRAKLFIRHTYETYLLSGTKLDILIRFCWVLVFLVFLKNLFFWLQAFFSSYAMESIIRDIRSKLYNHIQNLKMSYFTEQRTGEVISRIMNDTNILKEMVSLTFSNVIRDPLLVLVYLFLLLILNWKLTVSMFIVIPPVVFIIDRFGKHIRRYSRKGQEFMADIYAHLQESVLGMKITRLFSAENLEKKRFLKHLNRYLKVEVKRVRVVKLLTPFNEMVGTALFIFILWFGGRSVIIYESMRPEEFLQYIFALFVTMQPIKALSNDFSNIMQGLAAAERIFSLLDTEGIDMNKKDNTAPIVLKDSLVFENVSFAYNNNSQKVIKNVDLKIKKGQRVALVGPSGSGKSTLAELVLRLYSPTEGKIKLDNRDIEDLDLIGYRGLFGVVTQETMLFRDSVRNNIAYAKEDVDENKIIQAAKIADAHNFIMRLPDGYDSMISERGLTLSGGERQRIAIARAILPDPQILVFDEATSSLDSESENEVQKALDRVMEGRTVLIIAHRLSTITSCDWIFVMDSGKIVEQGTHSDLIKRDGLYTFLFKLQSGGML